MDSRDRALELAGELSAAPGKDGKPKGWFVTVAWRRFLDASRAEASRRRRENLVEEEPIAGPAAGDAAQSRVRRDVREKEVSST